LSENNNTNQFVKKLAEREGVSEKKIKEIIIDSFRKSYCQGENVEADLHFEFDTGLLVYRTYKIVEKVNHSGKEIEENNELLKENKVKDKTLFLPLDIKNLSISLNNEIKKQLRKDIVEIQGEKQYKEYKLLQGELVRGSIQNYQDDYYMVNLGKGIGYWEKKEWILPEKPRLGQSFYFLLKEVREKVEKDVPQIIVTRQDDLFLRKLLELEIPEIKEKIIVIRQILRVPGLLSKLVVESKKMGVDPLGTCIGKNAERIRTISRSIYPERLDIAPWLEDKRAMLFNLLSPAKVVSLVERGNDWDIIVPQKKVSLLLEHQGRVLKVIGKYLEKNIHVRILEELEKEKNVIIVWNGNLNFDDYQKLQ
jgi:N utilization substance protein A